MLSLGVLGDHAAGQAVVHDQGVADEPMAPFGGVKNSGYGRFGGTAGIDAFTNVRWITIQERGHTTYAF